MCRVYWKRLGPGLFSLAVWLFLGLLLSGRAFADGPEVLDIQQSDLDGDGQPDLAILSASLPFAYSGNYPFNPTYEAATVYVYDGGHDMQTASTWQQATDFENDTWIFDFAGDGTAELILVFEAASAGHQAYLYIDIDGDGQVSYRVSGSKVEILESDHWGVKVMSTSGDPWLLEGGVVNQNLVFQVDGYTGWEERFKLREALPYPETDGSIDWEYEVVDSGRDGIADYEVGRRLAPLDPRVNRQRAEVYVNANSRAAQGFDDCLFWPFLVTAHRRESYGFFDYTPAVYVDWPAAGIDVVGIWGYPTEAGYWINSTLPLEKGRVNMADFENPMTWYDLAQDTDGWPELFVRMEYFSANDARILGGTYPESRNQVAYAWDMDNDGAWDYQVDLAGRYALNAVAVFEDFSVATLDYASFPSWVVDRPWDAAILVSSDSGAYRGSEGFPLWTMNLGFDEDLNRIQSPLRDYYLTGVDEEPPASYYHHIPPGARGEYSFQFASQPYLYFSPFDRTLHLLGATWGLWHVDDIHSLVYENLDSDSYLDRWTYYEQGEALRSLLFAPPYLIYADGRQVRLVQIEPQQELFRTLPPRDHDEWRTLAKQLDAWAWDLPAGDLLAMFQQFEGAAMQISAVTLRDFRFTEAGFRFVLEPLSGALPTTSGELVLPGLEDLAWPALITYDGRLTALSLTPPQLYLDTASVSTLPTTLRELEDALIRIPLDNQGLEDTGVVTLTVHLRRGQEQEVLTTTLPTVPGQGWAVAQFDWAPPSPGLWDVSFALVEPAYQSEQASPVVQIPVSSAERESGRDLVLLGGGQGLIWAIGLLLASVALAAAAIGLLIGRALLRQVEG